MEKVRGYSLCNCSMSLKTIKVKFFVTRSFKVNIRCLNTIFDTLKITISQLKLLHNIQITKYVQILLGLEKKINVYVARALNISNKKYKDSNCTERICFFKLVFCYQDGRILFMDPVTKGKKYMEFKASKDAVSCSHFYIIYIHFPFHVHISYSALNINLKRGLVLRMYNSVAL